MSFVVAPLHTMVVAPSICDFIPFKKIRFSSSLIHINFRLNYLFGPCICQIVLIWYSSLFLSQFGHCHYFDQTMLKSTPRVNL